MNSHPSLSSPTVSPDTLGQDPTARASVLSLAGGWEWAGPPGLNPEPTPNGLGVWRVFSLMGFFIFPSWDTHKQTWGWAMAQQVKYLFCKNEDPHASDLQNSCKKPVTVENACNPISGEMRGR